MTEFFDAHRPATAFDHDSTLVVALELSGKSWQLGAVVPGVSRPPEHGLKAGDTAELPKIFRTTRNARLRRHLPTCRPQTKGQGHVCAIARHLSSSKKCRRIRSRVSGGAFTLRGSSPCWGDGRHDQARTRRACRKPICLRHHCRGLSKPRNRKGVRAIEQRAGSSAACGVDIDGRGATIPPDRRVDRRAPFPPCEGRGSRASCATRSRSRGCLCRFDATSQLLLGAKQKNGYVARGRPELVGDILSRNLVDDAQVNDRALHLVQCRHAGEHHRLLLGSFDDFVGGGRIGDETLDGRLVDEVRSLVIVTASAIARDVAGQDDQHPCRILRHSDQHAGLRQIQKTDERLLDAVQRICGSHAFAPHHSRKPRSVPMHQNGDPIIKSARPIRLTVRSRCFRGR